MRPLRPPGCGFSELQASPRREFLLRCGFGFGGLAVSTLLAEEAVAAAGDPLAARMPHAPARAKAVIFLFMSGGPSHLETFDPKPELQRLHGQPLPESFGPVATRRKVAGNPLLATRRTFARCGQSRIEISDFLPHLRGVADELAVLRGCHGDSVTHPESVYLMNTGSILMGRPSVGAWVSYGLGTLNRDMPSFVCLPDPGGYVKGGAPAWGSGFLPAAYQGTVLRSGKSPILNLVPPPEVTREQQRSTLDLVQRLNRRYSAGREGDSDLAARMAAYELAYRMQSRAPQLVDIEREPAHIREMYGVERPECGEFATRCLLARRMVEHGVRFVQLYCGDTNGWDGHSDIEGNHRQHCARVDRPAAALLRDLRQRGLLDSTLVVWAGEFGRTPMSEGGTGRDHNPHGFSIWMAGGGVRGGTVHGGTDAVGLRAETGRTHVHDIHATMLHLLGLDHRRLTFTLNGRSERLTDVAGSVIREVVA